jgi:hypothetical protein
MEKMEKINDWNMRKNYYGYYSQISLKVGNLVNDVEFKYNTHTSEIKTTIETVFKSLIEAGMVLEYDHIIESFLLEVEIAKAEYDKSIQVKKKHAYLNSWMLTTPDIISELNQKSLDKNLSVLSDTAITVSFQTLDEWMHLKNERIKVTYRKQTANIDTNYNNGKFEYYSQNGKLRQGKILKNLIKGFVKRVDEEIKEDTRQEDVEKTEAENREKTRANYQESLEHPVKIDRISKYDKYRPSEFRYYMITRYIIELNNQKISVSKHKDLWTIGNFGKMTLKQVKDLFKIFK